MECAAVAFDFNSRGMRRGVAINGGGIRGLVGRNCVVLGDSATVGVDVAVGFRWLGVGDGDENDDDESDDDDGDGSDEVVAIWDRLFGWRLARVDGVLC